MSKPIFAFKYRDRVVEVDFVPEHENYYLLFEGDEEVGRFYSFEELLPCVRMDAERAVRHHIDGQESPNA